MKCKCGNEQGKPLVSPRPIKIGGLKKDDSVDVLYMGGMCHLPDGLVQCWFCAFSTRPAPEVAS